MGNRGLGRRPLHPHELHASCECAIPSGDMPDPHAQQQSFSLANIVHQAPTLNDGVWEGIENAVRQLATRHGELYVVSRPAFRAAKSNP
jgi:DNA/RNA endonuclease G (NUC1)